MKKIRLIFGTHNSQPVGSYEFQYENAYQKAYKPFLTVLYNFPEIPLVLHYSGNLYQWFEDVHPEFLMLINEMIGRKQIELLGGGFYEPAFPLISGADRLGQIESLTTFVRKQFGKRPRGCWMTERIWEPTLASVLANSGMDYTFLDDHHFRAAGFGEDELLFPCLTEDQGKTVTVFPISQRLRQCLFAESPEKTIEFIRSCAGEEEQVIVMMDDGERFGAWEGTERICYEEKWLQSFLTLVLENKEWLEPLTPGKYMKSFAPWRKGYFPCTAYVEMMGWMLKPERKQMLENLTERCSSQQEQAFIQGGYFRQFLSRYPESNFLYSKMVYTQILVNQIRGDKYKKKTARDELWKGQCHAAYWHGKIGGIYSNHLRKETYRSLIEAEKITREKGVFIPSIISTDFDLDGHREYLYQGYDLNAYIHCNGGMLFELDFLGTNWNYLDTFTRQPELYHDAQTARKGYDAYLRKAFVDHFFQDDVTIQAFETMKYKELGDFLSSWYDTEDVNRDHNELQLKKAGNVLVQKERFPVEIWKKFIFKRTSVNVYYTITNLSDKPLSTTFGSEINLSFASNGIESLRIHQVDQNHKKEIGNESSELEEVLELHLEDVLNGVLVSLSSQENARVWSFPVHTVSQSLSSLEEIYQSTCIVLRWPVELAQGESWGNRISMRLDKK